LSTSEPTPTPTHNNNIDINDIEMLENIGVDDGFPFDGNYELTADLDGSSFNKTISTVDRGIIIHFNIFMRLSHPYFGMRAFMRDYSYGIDSRALRKAGALIHLLCTS
jgi:hypothetical protein